MALDACRALKLECPAEGGTQLNTYPTEIDPSQDALTAAGLYLQNAAGSATDKTTLLSRTSGGMAFQDANASRVLGELVSRTLGQSTAHQGLADIIHFLGDGGPGDGWASGAYQTAGYSGPLLTSTAWWTSAAQTQRIFTIVYTYTGPLVATATYTLYDAKGTQARQLVDTFAYNGPLCTAVTRTWS